MNKFTAVFERDGDWWIGNALGTARHKYAKGRTLPEARENLKEAVEMIIEANRELSRLGIGSDAIRAELLVAA